MKDYNTPVFDLEDGILEINTPPLTKPISNLRADIEKRKELKQRRKLHQQYPHMTKPTTKKTNSKQPHWAELILILNSYDSAVREYSQITDFYTGKITDIPEELKQELESYKSTLITDIHRHVNYSKTIHDKMITTDKNLDFVNINDLPTFYNLCTQLSNYQSELVSVVHPIAMKVQLIVQTYSQFHQPKEVNNAK